jgi:TetR/AcrR family transcriptional regulator, cholesterol catabolism regulator
MPRTPLATAAPPRAAAPPKLIASQLRRMRRIVDAAVELAEQGGFDAVRLRDVAERSDVALGTLYKYFRSKEDILLFAFDEGVTRLEQSLAIRPAAGGSAQERVTGFFRRATRGLLHNPDLGSALVRAMSGSERETAQQIAASNRRIARMIVASLRDEPSVLLAELASFEPSESERELADALTGVWFAALIGWVIGADPDPASIPRKMRSAARLMLEGPGRASAAPVLAEE